MQTLTLAGQMQAIFDRLEEPAVINADRYEVLGSYAEIEAAARYTDAAILANVDATGNGENPNEDDDLVPMMFACPLCHERRPDFLLLNDDGDVVACESCGHIYRIGQSADAEWADNYALAHPGALM